MTSKRSIGWFLESSRAWRFFTRAFAQPTKSHARLYPFDKPFKSLYFRSFVVSVLFARFHSRVIRKSLYSVVEWVLSSVLSIFCIAPFGNYSIYNTKKPMQFFWKITTQFQKPTTSSSTWQIANWFSRDKHFSDTRYPSSVLHRARTLVWPVVLLWPYGFSRELCFTQVTLAAPC